MGGRLGHVRGGERGGGGRAETRGHRRLRPTSRRVSGSLNNARHVPCSVPRARSDLSAGFSSSDPTTRPPMPTLRAALAVLFAVALVGPLAPAAHAAPADSTDTADDPLA